MSKTTEGVAKNRQADNDSNVTHATIGSRLIHYNNSARKGMCVCVSCEDPVESAPLMLARA